MIDVQEEGQFWGHIDSVKLVKAKDILHKGRPRSTTLTLQTKPSKPYLTDSEKDLKKHIRKDKLLKLLRSDPSSLDVLDQMIEDLARESAVLSYERSKLASKGMDTTVTSGKKISALKTLADLFFRKRQEVLNTAFDFRSKRFERLLEWILTSVVRDAALQSDLSEEQVNILFDHIGKRFDDPRWEKEAMDYIKA